MNFNEWISSILHELKKPVNNKLLYNEYLNIMVVNGPNHRDDFHIQCGEEIFYQLKGYMVLNVIEGNEFKEIKIDEDEMFLLPGNISHSPQRFEDTIGLVIERSRDEETEKDGLLWYHPKKTSNILYHEYFYCYNLGTQLKPVIENFYNSDIYKTKTPSESNLNIDIPTKNNNDIVTLPPINFNKWLLEQKPHYNTYYNQLKMVPGDEGGVTGVQNINIADKGQIYTLFNSEFILDVCKGMVDMIPYHLGDIPEVFLYQIGNTYTEVYNESKEKLCTIDEQGGCVVISKPKTIYIKQEQPGILLMVSNKKYF